MLNSKHQKQQNLYFYCNCIIFIFNILLLQCLIIFYLFEVVTNELYYFLQIVMESISRYDINIFLKIIFKFLQKHLINGTKFSRI